MRLKGKLAAITAGASGMGKAASLKFAKEGATVAIIDINEAAAKDVAGQIQAEGGTAFAIRETTSSGSPASSVSATAREKPFVRS